MEDAKKLREALERMQIDPEYKKQEMLKLKKLTEQLKEKWNPSRAVKAR